MNISGVINQAKNAGTWLAYRQAAKKIKENYEIGAVTPNVTFRTAFLSSFTIEPLIDFAIVEAASENIYLDTYVGGYGQYNQEILNPNSGLYKFSPDITFLMIEFNAVFPKEGSEFVSDAAEQVIQHINSLAQTFKKNSKSCLLLNTFIAQPSWPLHPIEGEESEIIHETNRKLKEAFADDTNVRICDSDVLAAYYGYRNTFSSQMMYMARIPFSEGFLDLLARKYVSCLKAQEGMIRKCLVLDCDNTLWGGIIGEDGLDGIRLGPDFPGREYLDFQHAILELFDQGVILAINSKNNYEDAIKVLREHPHMLLKEKNFASFQINWDDKPSNMYRIAEEINIGIDSLVFLDDSPIERELMRKSIPEIYTVELPGNPIFFTQILRESSQFVRYSFTQEDRERGKIYATQRQRTEFKKTAFTMEDFLYGLEIVITIQKAKPQDIKRLAQLTQRTNQFNLTTRRYNEADIKEMIDLQNCSVYVLQAKDRFGDNGIVGLAIIELDESSWRIDTFLMSCRVIGRQIEDALIDFILRDAAKGGAHLITSEFIRTKKNGLVEKFWGKMGFQVVEQREERSTWQLDIDHYRPKIFKYLQILEAEETVEG